MFYPPAHASVPAPAPLANMASAVVVKFDLGALPSSEKKTRMTSHQVQLERENKKKLASVNDLATLRATTLLSEEVKRDRSQSQSKALTNQAVDERSLLYGHPLRQSQSLFKLSLPKIHHRREGRSQT